MASDLSEIGRDLLVMEISTIASDSITGRKMPWFPHALIDILSKYANWFVTTRDLRVDAILALPKPLTPTLFSELMVTDKADPDTSITNGWRTIEQLRRTAKLVTDDALLRTAGKGPVRRSGKRDCPSNSKKLRSAEVNGYTLQGHRCMAAISSKSRWVCTRRAGTN